MRRSLVGGIFTVLASLLLGSCGGGGASNVNPAGGVVQILPNNGTLFAGVEYTFTASGGRPPYFISSSEPALLPVPFSINGHTFSVVPANPAVIDANLPPDSYPVRTVTLTIRDSTGQSASTGDALQVGVNFLTGYPVSFASNCAGTGTVAGPAFCAGGETAVEVSANISGNWVGNRQYRFEVVRGPIFFVNIPGNGTLGPGGSTWTTRTDHEGDAHAIIRTNPNIASQIAIFRVVDVATGASTQYVVNLNGVPISGGSLTALPSEFTFIGRDNATCGTGTADFLVFDGIPPYTATSSFPSSLIVEPTVSNENPGRFRLAATNPFFCMDEGAIVITDAAGRRTTVTVTTELGTNDPPPPTMVFTPASLVLSCGTAGTVIISGGSGTFSGASPDPRISVTISGRTATITRGAVDPAGTPVSPTPGTPNPVAFAVNITDGTQTSAIGITAPSNCPP
jgi:hypothetical protein